MLVGRDGQLVAVRGEDGRLAALPAPQAGFELARWLEHDGDARSAQEATKAAGFRCDGAGCVAQVQGAAVAVVRHAAAIADDCQRAAILVLPVPKPAGCSRPRLVLDFFRLRAAGTHAIYVQPGADLRIETVAGARGDRPWSRQQPRGNGSRLSATASSAPPGRGRATSVPLAPSPGRDTALPRPEIEDDDEPAGEAPAEPSRQ
jgi:competence protein ComEC